MEQLVVYRTVEVDGLLFSQRSRAEGPAHNSFTARSHHRRECFSRCWQTLQTATI